LVGKYEIGMTTEMVRDALMNQRTSKSGAVALFPFYKKSESASSETWRFDWNLLYAKTNITPQQMAATGVDCPILMFKNGKLTDIIR
jgi:hypothetical protein